VFTSIRSPSRETAYCLVLRTAEGTRAAERAAIPGRQAEFHAGSSQSALTPCFPALNLHIDTACECH
jgi:hypothetical protein